MNAAASVCAHLDCGSPVVIDQTRSSADRPVWKIRDGCFWSRGSLRGCTSSSESPVITKVNCSDSVRLLNGSSLCSGRLEVKSNQSWASVCEADFDQQDAEVVCRELGCGPPAVLQGALYGEVEAPVWSKEFQCGGHESALLDCRSSGSARTSCSPGKAVGLTCSEPVRLVGGASRCAGTLELKLLGDWRPVYGSDWTLKEAGAVCQRLDCGSAVSAQARNETNSKLSWGIYSQNVAFQPDLRELPASTYITNVFINLTCSDSVRLLNGSSLCSGRLEVKSDQSWASVCEADFDQQDAEVVCRELGCGPPAVPQGALYGEGEAPVWSKEFQCEGHESALLDCRSSGSARTSCSPGKAVGLTCSEPYDIRLVGGASRCGGTVELKHLGEWFPLDGFEWTVKEAAVICQRLDCGSVLSVKKTEDSYSKQSWLGPWHCVQSLSDLRDCVIPGFTSRVYHFTCSDSVRLLNGSSLCSGRLEVKSDQSWASVCEADFDQQDAEVVCRELGCGPPAVPQGALYGEVEAPVWSKEFQCGGHESALLDCRSSGSARTSCSPGKAVGLTCSDSYDIRLVGGASRCAGTLELKLLGEWRPMSGRLWTVNESAVICEHLNCGSAVSVEQRIEFSSKPSWDIRDGCTKSLSDLRDCPKSKFTYISYHFTCSDSVRLLNGSSLCSGRLEVKSDQSWASVCEADFDQQDAEVVCRELGCGPPAVLQGALYGEVEAPVWSKEFQCGGHESTLLDCRSSGSARTSCSPGKAVGLTCSEPVRLVGGASRCAGRLELKHLGKWRPVIGSDWTLKEAAVICQHLDCGSAVSSYRQREGVSTVKFHVWVMTPDCVQGGSALGSCAVFNYSLFITHITCSDLLIQPIISGSSMDGVSEAQQQGLQVSRSSNFTISCSIQPQFPGGFFQLTFNEEYKYMQAAVNHSAHFLFPPAEPAHQGSYSCVYHVYVFSHNFSSESRLLSVTVSDPTGLIIRVVLLPLILLLENVVLYFYCKVSRGRKSRRREHIELVDRKLSVCAAEGGPAEEGARGEEEDVPAAHRTSR
ncbi:scavenger receptor cysteine-rich type 1 protein M130-like isoform X2 [Archocentrus centrarchus]|nr:scavenger receptor cysteine-rich type 1 protein M130-like isoform X2 [Archocentrus centrarchus]XP_030598246.1 scavenger receptor cysteine-rich type 1 protein M130-like isoform X2 [Archocentrus centrarchus]